MTFQVSLTPSTEAEVTISGAVNTSIPTESTEQTIINEIDNTSRQYTTVTDIDVVSFTTTALKDTYIYDFGLQFYAGSFGNPRGFLILMIDGVKRITLIHNVENSTLGYNQGCDIHLNSPMKVAAGVVVKLVYHNLNANATAQGTGYINGVEQ